MILVNMILQRKPKQKMSQLLAFISYPCKKVSLTAWM